MAFKISEFRGRTVDANRARQMALRCTIIIIFYFHSTTCGGGDCGFTPPYALSNPDDLHLRSRSPCAHRARPTTPLHRRSSVAYYSYVCLYIVCAKSPVSPLVVYEANLRFFCVSKKIRTEWQLKKKIFKKYFSTIVFFKFS